MTDPNKESNSDDMPLWIKNDTEIDPQWMQSKTHLPVTKCLVVKDISNQTRKGESVRNGATIQLLVTLKDNVKLSMVMKQVPPSGLALSQQLGLAREALFYQQLAPLISSDDNNTSMIPKIYYTFADMKAGSKIVLMEDLSNFVDSGILFGPGNPNNWNRDLPELIARAFPQEKSTTIPPPPTSVEVARQTFTEMAKVHAMFWKDTQLLDRTWLRGSQWIQGQDEASWKASQGILQNIWSQEGMDDKIQWDPLVKSIINKAMDGISWESQLTRLNTTNAASHWTLVHGDFWPGNVMWPTAAVASSGENDVSPSLSLRLIDWEMVGIGSGPQELGQYLLSNMDPSVRHACEESLVKSYYEQLVATYQAKHNNNNNSYNDDMMTWDECWKEYRVGGLERWLWFLVYFCGQEHGNPLLEWAQFFHNQILAFCRDHHIGPDDIVQPRP